jgi:RimJ/RimL family protein N-acetyltransferase
VDIRQLGEADAADYRELRLRGLREHPEAFTSSYEEERAKPLEWTLSRVKAGVVLGAYEGRQLVGVLGLSIEPRAKIRHKGHVFGMYVAPEHAGRGVGRALLAECIARAKHISGLELLQLTVTDGNDRAKALYEKAGFRQFALERNAMKLGGRHFDKCHMALELVP